MSLRTREMFRRSRCLIVGILLVFVFVGGLSWASPASNSDATQQLQSAVHRLNVRIGSGVKAEGWRRFLLLNVLETQAAKGEQADLIALQQLHQQFSSQYEGLNHPVFVDVRIALENQIQNISSARTGDLAMSLEMAKSQFQPISIGTMQAYRDQAKMELEKLKVYYRQELPSPQRAELFSNLQLDEMNSFLDEIEFELAPEVSFGKMNSMIRAMRDQLNEVIEKIDALPFRPTDEKPEEDLSLERPTQDVPQPDDENGLVDLKTQRAALTSRIEELQQQRDEIRKQDLPRVRTRAANLRRLFELEQGFADEAENHGDPFFVSSRLAFERFVRAYYYGTEDNLQEDFLLRIERLAQDVPALNDPLARQAAGQVGITLEWLESAFQVPHLVTAIRARHSMPNAYVRVSGNFLNRIGGQSLNQTRPVYENVKGQLVRGHATATGQVSFDLLDDPNQVNISIRAYTDVTSDTYLQQRKITAYIGASGQGEARRSILMNVGGVLEYAPQAAANINTFFQGTSSNCGLVNRIAERKFAEAQAEGDLGASDRVRTELLERFSSETIQPIAQGKRTLADAKKKSRNKSSYLPEIYAHTQSNRVIVVGKKSSKATLAAPDYPVEFGTNCDIEARLHDSLPTNYLDPIFSGKTFTNEELAQELEKLLGQKPEALQPQPNDGVPAKDESFTITFTNVRPIQFVFEDNALAIVVSGKSFSQGEKKIDAGLTIKLRFRINRTNGKLWLVRDGRAELDYVDAVNKDAKIVAFRSFLDGRLNPKDQAPEPVELPANLLPVDKVEALQNRPEAQWLMLSQCRIENGWFYLGWNYVPPGSSLAHAVDLPAIWSETTIEQMDSIYTPVLEGAQSQILNYPNR